MSATATYEEVNKGCFDDLVYILTQINHIDLQSRVFEVTQKLNYIPENTVIPQLSLFAKKACEEEIEFAHRFTTEILGLVLKFKDDENPVADFFLNYLGKVEKIYNSMHDDRDYALLLYFTISSMFALVHSIVESKWRDAHYAGLTSES